MIEQSRAECRFFTLTHRFGADRIDQTQDDHFVSQQLQGPVTSPTGRWCKQWTNFCSTFP